MFNLTLPWLKRVPNLGAKSCHWHCSFTYQERHILFLGNKCHYKNACCHIKPTRGKNTNNGPPKNSACGLPIPWITMQPMVFAFAKDTSDVSFAIKPAKLYLIQDLFAINSWLLSLMTLNILGHTPKISSKESGNSYPTWTHFPGPRGSNPYRFHDIGPKQCWAHWKVKMYKQWKEEGENIDDIRTMPFWCHICTLCQKHNLDGLQFFLKMGLHLSFSILFKDEK